MTTRKNNNMEISVVDGILHISYSPQTIMIINEGLKSTEICNDLVGENLLPMLCDLTHVVKMSQYCRMHLAGPEHAKFLLSAPF